MPQAVIVEGAHHISLRADVLQLWWCWGATTQSWDEVLDGYRDAQNPHLCRAVRAFATALCVTLVDPADLRALTLDERRAVLSVLYEGYDLLDESHCESSCTMLARLLSGWWLSVPSSMPVAY